MFLLQSDIFLWDFAILLLLAVTLSGALACFVWCRRSNKSLLPRTLAATLSFVSLCGFLLVAYAAFIEPQIIVTTRTSVEHPLAEPMTIVVVSDFHIGPYKGAAFVERAVRRINETLPDLVLLPGDFVFTHAVDLDDLNPLQNLRTTLGTFAVLGNHDLGKYMTFDGKRYSGESRGDAVAETLESLGVTVLRNSAEALPVAQGKTYVAGIDDLWTGHFDMNAAMGAIPIEAFTILISHNPSVIQEPLAPSAHLIVTGHTHGGQMRIPGFGPLTTLPTSIGNAYDQGLFTIDDDTTLAITRGIGESSARTRLFAWPEILLIEVNGG